MTKYPIVALTALFLLSSCTESDLPDQKKTEKANEWNIEELKQLASHQLDSTKWDQKLFKQDIETYRSYSEFFLEFPLNKSPFPVAEYDYAVSSVPFVIEKDGSILKGIKIGEFDSSNDEKIIDKLTLLILTNDEDSKENTFVDSRNFPYLTAQGCFRVINNRFDWVFSASPDGFSTLLINMKLFDLRFGETIVIYPQTDQSFLYDQIADSPNNYRDFEDFKKSIMNRPEINTQLFSKKNIQTTKPE